MNLARMVALVAALVVAVSSPTDARSSFERWSEAAAPAPRDPHSYARPEIARVTHVALDLVADFEARRLFGTASLDLRLAAGAQEVVLDTRELDIEAVTDARGRPLDWSLGDEDPVLGRPLTVKLRPGVRRIIVRYATRPDADAIQWLGPEQTAGKRRPFLFTQGQAILTRTWIPTQDSPGVRQTYEARITTPSDLRAVMSARSRTATGKAVEGGRQWRFSLDKPVPPYLIALAIGDIAFKPLGRREGVYAEPSVLEQAAYEFADLETMMEAAERLYGPYRWGRYDVLVLPPAFPYGGMENPRTTFATPTILAGDRSLVSLIAHELAHSWSGNLVTNATWGDFWLNEGFTTYFENRIMEEVYGPERAAMLAALGWRDMIDDIEALGPQSPDTRLELELEGRDPDEGSSNVAYEKGAAFLRHVESTVGRERFDAWLRSYFDRHAFKPMTTERMLADMREALVAGDSELERRLMIDAWVRQPGVPDGVSPPRSDILAAVDVQTEAFTAGAAASSLKTSGWTTQEWQRFLQGLPRSVPADRLAELDATFRLSEQGNSEVLFAWLIVAVRNRYEPAVPAAERFLTSMGRRKFVAPLFRAFWAEGDWGQAHARRIYAKARPGYHAVTSGTVDEIVR